MPNSTLFDELVSRASVMDGAHFSLGGNAPLMAQRLSQEGCQVLLAATMTPRLRHSIAPSLKVVGGTAARDDVHLILEYKAGDLWGPYTAPRANRFIIHNDNNNPVISSLEEFQQALKSFNTDLLVVSGLQMMDNYPFEKGERRKRLLGVREQMLSQPPKTRIHFEMASYTEMLLLEQLVDLVIPHSDSLGMNEQELANLVSLYQFGNVSFVSDSNPRVATVLDQMRHLLRLIETSSKEKPGSRKLTRIHVHTLAYQAILTVDTTLWPHSDIAAAKASLTAYRHVCASPQVSLYDTHPCAYSGLPSHSHSGHNSVASLGHSSSQGLLDCIQTCLCLSSDMSVPLLRSVYMIHIHVHTVAYQAILTVDTTLWPHSDIAAAKASLTAYRHVCASPQVSLYDTHPCAYCGLPSHSHSGHNSVASLT
ncbi:hypothetical protein J6590_099167 [Homalodisca vitripennis]|nr:hypothetical protein J6590_099167 [Homalodisca vitripennis]